MEQEQTQTIEQKLASMDVQEQITFLQKKDITIPAWDELDKAYDSEKHDVMTDPQYHDIITGAHTDKVSRITCDLPALAVKRMTELITGVPIKRVYHAEDEGQKEAAKYLENIFQRCRIDSVNIDRLDQLYASCEVLTLWYAVESQEKNKLYGFDTKLKIRCRTFSPMKGDKLYPKFDETGDCIALSVAYTFKSEGKTTEYMDTYTATKHYRYTKTEGSDWTVESENLKVGKIPAIYMYRPSPIWENADRINTEIEWTLSRHGNYLRKNSKPMLGVYANESIPVNKALPETSEFKEVVQLPEGARMEYATWGAAIDSLKFYVEQLKQMYWTQLQLPDWSYDNMKNNQMSGESRKQLFIDAQLKVKDESGRVLEFCDREVNVVKEFLKIMQPGLAEAINSLQVETVITPFTISDEKDTIDNINAARSGGLISQREAIERLGWSNDPDKTLEALQEEQQQAIQMANAAEMAE